MKQYTNESQTAELMSLDALMRRLPAVICPRTGDDAELAIVYNSRGPYWVAGYRRISDNKWLRLPSAKVVHEDDDLKRCLYLLMTDLEGGVKDKKKIIAEICEAKRRQGIHPALATEVEIKQGLIRQGVRLPAAEFKEFCAAMAEDNEIITRRLLRYNGYELKTTHDADTTETNT